MRLKKLIQCSIFYGLSTVLPLELACATTIDITWQMRPISTQNGEEFTVVAEPYRYNLTGVFDFKLTLDRDNPNSGATLSYKSQGPLEIRSVSGDRRLITTAYGSASGTYSDIHYYKDGKIDSDTKVDLETFLSSFASTDTAANHFVTLNSGGNPLAASIFGSSVVNLVSAPKYSPLTQTSFNFFGANGQALGWFMTAGGRRVTSGDLGLFMSGGFHIPEGPPPPPPPGGEVPEPASVTLMLTGLSGLLKARRAKPIK